MSCGRAFVLQEELESFLQAMPVESIAGELALRCGFSVEEAKAFLNVYANEMRTTFDLVGDMIDPNFKILEVGAGLCLFSLFLKIQGYDITALEPSAGGFGKFEVAKRVILDAYADLDLHLFEFPAQDLSSCNDKFDLIFSNNVLEHIPTLGEAWLGMCVALKPQGVMVHNCPNYVFPYEPHLGIPVFKYFPWLSAFCFRRSVTQNRAIWDSLNFITYFDVRRLARISGMKVSFKRGLLFDSLRRIERDPFFRERHSGSFILAVYAILCKIGLLGLLRYVPPALSTPMIFYCCRSRAWLN